MIDIRDLTSGKVKHIYNVLRHISYKIMYGTTHIEIQQIITNNNLDDIFSKEDINELIKKNKFTILGYAGYSYRWYGIDCSFNPNVFRTTEESYELFINPYSHLEYEDSVTAFNESVLYTMLKRRRNRTLHYGFNKNHKQEGYVKKPKREPPYNKHPNDVKNTSWRHRSCWHVESLLRNRKRHTRDDEYITRWYIDELGYNCNVRF